MQFFSKVKTKLSPFKKNIKSRIWEVDFFRCICILFVLFDHLMYDFTALPYWSNNFYIMGKTPFYYISEFADVYWSHPIRIAVRIALVFLLVLLSGLSSSLSRSNSKRLVKLTAASVLVSTVTILMDLMFGMGISIYFGILHILSLSLLIYMLLNKLWNNKYFFLIVGAIIIAGSLLIKFNSVPYYHTFSYPAFFESIIGLCMIGADSYGILPYTGIFLVGVFLGRLLYEDKTSLLPSFNVSALKPFNFIGRNTIYVYIIHQPIILGIVMLIALMAGYQF